MKKPINEIAADPKAMHRMQANAARAVPQAPSPGDLVDIELPDVESTDDRTTGMSDMELMQNCNDFIMKSIGGLNKIGIILSAKFQDFSTRESLMAVNDQLNRIINAINEKIVRQASSSRDIDALLPGEKQ